MIKVTKEAALEYHSKGKPGKIEVVPTKPYRTQYDLSLAYSPGVAEPCLEIQKEPNENSRRLGVYAICKYAHTHADSYVGKLYKRIGVGFVLLVLLFRVMRRPQVVERVMIRFSTLFV